MELYREPTRLRPVWHDDEDDRGAIKVVMTGMASDQAEWQAHIRNKPRREASPSAFATLLTRSGSCSFVIYG